MLTNFLVPTSFEKSGLHCKINKIALNNKTLLIFYTVRSLKRVEHDSLTSDYLQPDKKTHHITTIKSSIKILQYIMDDTYFNNEYFLIFFTWRWPRGYYAQTSNKR